jgi:L-arabinokinase
VPAIVFYVTGHGFGHASRVIEVINALSALRPDLGVVVRTSAARWLFELTACRRVTFHEVECDTGVVQIDSLHPDLPATVARAAGFYAGIDARIEAEARWLDATRPALVVGDIPPLAFAAAHRAGVPAAAFSNFTWDWIYEGYRDHLGAAAWLPARLSQLQATAMVAWRLPMHGAFAPYRHVVDVPFVARHARRARDEVRRALGIDPTRPVVLVSFGGFGLEGLPLDEVAGDSRFTIVTTDVPDPAQSAAPIVHRRRSGVVVINEDALYAAGYRYEDVVCASDVVVTKPGYGILAEAIANGPAVLYTSRGPFAEYDVLVREMPRYLRCGFITHEDLLGGRWSPHLGALLDQPPPPERPATNGAEVVARLALEMV